jgi:hypothetical protein
MRRHGWKERQGLAGLKIGDLKSPARSGGLRDTIDEIIARFASLDTREYFRDKMSEQEFKQFLEKNKEKEKIYSTEKELAEVYAAYIGDMKKMEKFPEIISACKNTISLVNKTF